MSDDDASIWSAFADSAPTPGAPQSATGSEPWAARRPRITALVAGAATVALLGGVAGVAIIANRSGPGVGRQVSTKVGRDQAKPPPAVRLEAVPASSAAAGSARVRTSLSTVDQGTPITTTVEGVVGLAGAKAFDVTMHATGIDALAAGMLGPDAFGGDQRVFSDGTTVWIPLPPYLTRPDLLGGFSGSGGLTAAQKRDIAKAAAQRTAMLKGKVFLSAPLDPPGDASAGDLGSSRSGATDVGYGFGLGHDPADVLNYLRSVSGDVREVGAETVGTDATTRYEFGVDIDILQRALPSDARDFDGYDFLANVPHRFPASAWIDGDGRLRKLTYRLDLGALLTPEALKRDHTIEDCPPVDAALIQKATKAPKAAQRKLSALPSPCTERAAKPEELIIDGSIELFDYGTPLAVAAPPAAQVISEEQLYNFSPTGVR